MLKPIISNLLRKLGLLFILDYVRFAIKYCKTFKERNKFKNENRGVKLPPDFLMYESFGLNYDKYYNDGLDTAKFVLGIIEKHVSLSNIKILDWGCGPARVVRHLPSLLDNSCSVYGSDYNKKSIAWCQKNIEGVTFKNNYLAPPLAFDDGLFNIIYSISIFTHLSEEMHEAWFNELLRVTAKGGIIFTTTHGTIFKSKLLVTEQAQFDKGDLVIKGNTKEGHRTFAAFHPVSYMKKLIGENQVLEYRPGTAKNGYLEQDIWIIRKA